MAKSSKEDGSAFGDITRLLINVPPGMRQQGLIQRREEVVYASWPAGPLGRRRLRRPCLVHWQLLERGALRTLAELAALAGVRRDPSAFWPF
jgi:hypothetical protein